MSIYTYVDPREHQDIRARQGEEVWLSLYHVRAEKREVFEDFLREIWMPALAHVHPETYNKTRILHPAIQNKDGACVYALLMDPVVAEDMRSISGILYKFYRPELADRYLKMWNETLASPPEEYDMLQSPW